MIIMKKKLITIIVGMMLCAELLGGCGNKNINKDNITTDTAEESKQQDSDKKQPDTDEFIALAQDENMIRSLKMELMNNMIEEKVKEM